jgi:ribosomal-protein-serine acetyltransferase
VSPPPARAAPDRDWPDPAPPHAFALRLDDELALRLSERHHVASLHQRILAERARLAGAFGWARQATEATTRNHLESALEQFRRGDGWHADLCWLGRPIGAVWLHMLQARGGSTEIGYWLAEAFEGRGLMTRAMRALQRHFFEGRGLGRVSIAVDPRNGDSAGVPNRLGYRGEAVLRRAHVGPDRLPADLAFFGLLREEWDAAGGAGVAEPLPLPRFALRVDDELQLALLERDDAPALAALIEANRAHLLPWMPWAADTAPGATLDFIERRALPAIATADGFEAGVWWRGRLVGSAGVHSLRRSSCSGSLGYWLAVDAQGRGIVTRSVRALVDKALIDHGLGRIDIRADAANARSRAVAERLGFRFEGVLRREYWNGRSYVDLAVYSMMRSEWRSGASWRHPDTPRIRSGR